MPFLSKTSITAPDLGAVETTAFTADYFGGERAMAAQRPAQLFAALHFGLHRVEFVWLDNGGMAVLDIVLRNFTFITI